MILVLSGGLELGVKGSMVRPLNPEHIGDAWLAMWQCGSSNTGPLVRTEQMLTQDTGVHWTKKWIWH